MSDRDKTEEPAQGDLFPVEHAHHLSSRFRRLFYNPNPLLVPLVNAGDTVVDLGCGPGYYTLPLARMVGDEGRVIAVDVQQEMLSTLRERAEEAGLANRIQPHLTSDETIGLETILEAGPGGHYLDKMHTVRHLRNEHWQPGIWSRQMLRPWMETDGTLDVDRAREKVLAIQQTATEPEAGMSPQFEREVLNIIDRARRELVDG